MTKRLNTDEPYTQRNGKDACVNIVSQHPDRPLVGWYENEDGYVVPGAWNEKGRIYNSLTKSPFDLVNSTVRWYVVLNDGYISANHFIKKSVALSCVSNVVKLLKVTCIGSDVTIELEEV